MNVPLLVIVLLGLGCLGFLMLLFRPRGERDLTQAPPTAAPAAPRFTMPPLPGAQGIPPEVVAELRAMVANDQKLQAIKCLRELTHCGLTEAKEWVERL